MENIFTLHPELFSILIYPGATNYNIIASNFNQLLNRTAQVTKRSKELQLQIFMRGSKKNFPDGVRREVE